MPRKSRDRVLWEHIFSELDQGRVFEPHPELDGLAPPVQLIKQWAADFPKTIDVEGVDRALAAYDEAQANLCKSNRDREALSAAVLGAMFVAMAFERALHGESLAAHQSHAARSAKSHVGLDDMKAMVAAWYDNYGHKYRSVAAAAKALAKERLVPLQKSTLERYLGEYARKRKFVVSR